MIDTTVRHYRILRALGRGGMGEVYAAEDAKLHREVALKILPPAMAVDPDRLQRFQREAQAVAALNHPNVVTVYSVEEAEGRALSHDGTGRRENADRAADSRRVVFGDGGGNLWVVDSQTRQTTKIYSGARDILGPPRLSRDGRRLVYTRRVNEADVWMMTLR